MFILGLCISYPGARLLGKSENSKYHIILLFSLSFTLLLISCLGKNSLYSNIASTVLISCIIPLCYLQIVSTQWFIAYISALALVSACAGCLFYFELLSTDLLSTIFSWTLLVVQILGLGYSSYLVTIGYSDIPDLLINPTIQHMMEKSNLYIIQENIEKTRSNVGFKYTCRGLPVPKYEKSNLKDFDLNLDEIKSKIRKLDKKFVNNSYAQWLMILLGSLSLILGFWVFILLMSILIESVALSDCGWTCGFQAKTRINTIFSGFSSVFSVVVGVFYLCLCLIGYSKTAELKPKGTSLEDLLGITLVCAVCSQSVEILLSYFFPSHYDFKTNIVVFCLESALCLGSILYFIYINFMKCKKKTKN